MPQAWTLARTASGLGVPLLARPAWNDVTMISRLLDDGFEGIICPMINSAKDASKLAAAARYAPLAERSFGPVRVRVTVGADYWKEASESLLILAMIETREALAALPEIIAVDGISGVYVGPADLSLTMIGQPTGEPTDPAVVTLVEDIRKTVQQAGRIAAVHNLTTDHTRKMAPNAWDMVTGPSDLALLSGASEDAVRRIKGK